MGAGASTGPEGGVRALALPAGAMGGPMRGLERGSTVGELMALTTPTRLLCHECRTVSPTSATESPSACPRCGSAFVEHVSALEVLREALQARRERQGEAAEAPDAAGQAEAGASAEPQPGDAAAAAQDGEGAEGVAGAEGPQRQRLQISLPLLMLLGGCPPGALPMFAQDLAFTSAMLAHSAAAAALRAQQQQQQEDENAPKPLSSEHIRHLRRQSAPDISREGECVICIGPLASESLTALPACAHVFHTDCVVQWLERNDSCPSCRAAVSSGLESSGGVEAEAAAAAVASVGVQASAASASASVEAAGAAAGTGIEALD